MKHGDITIQNQSDILPLGVRIMLPSIDLTSTTPISVTGVGFKPSMVVAFGGVASTNGMSIGIDTGVSTQRMSIHSSDYVSPDTWNIEGFPIYIAKAGGHYYAYLTMDSDGFTITVSNPSTGTGSYYFMCFK